jgi:predicted transport protein
MELHELRSQIEVAAVALGHWGTGNLRVSVASDDDIDQVMPLIKQAYELQR